MKVYQRLAQAFKAEGCTATFGMMGDGNMYWVHELHKLGIKVHEVRHEGCGAGYGRRLCARHAYPRRGDCDLRARRNPTGDRDS